MNSFITKWVSKNVAKMAVELANARNNGLKGVSKELTARINTALQNI